MYGSMYSLYFMRRTWHSRKSLPLRSQIFDYSKDKWNPSSYVQKLTAHRATLSSLSPTHVYDLVNGALSPPSSIRAIIVGGGALAGELHEKAVALGWPLLKSYGLTETCSQVATALDSHPAAELQILSHVDLMTNEEGFIRVRGSSLLTGFVHGNDPERRFIDPKVEGWYTTQDRELWREER